MIRFTPRRPGSIWSAVNVKRVRALSRRRRMKAAGMHAFQRRSAAKTAIYSFEQKDATLSAAHTRLFKANPEAWRFFRARGPGYQRIATWFVISAKREETKLRRLKILIEASAGGRVIGPMTRKTPS